MHRWILVAILAVLEATIVSLAVATLTTLPLPWVVLVTLVGIGWFGDWLVMRVPAQAERPLLAMLAITTALTVVAVVLGRGLVGTVAALVPGATGFATAYGTTLLTLYLFWRGTRVGGYTSDGVLTLFGRGAVALVVLVALFALGGRTADPVVSNVVTLHLVGFFGLGLLALALANGADDTDGVAKRIDWRWMGVLALSIGLVVLVGTVLAGLLSGGGVLNALQNLLAVLLFPFVLVGGAIAWVFFAMFGGVLRWIAAQLALLLQQTPPQEQTGAEAAPLLPPQSFSTLERIFVGTTWLLALIPIVILIVLAVLLRRRQRNRRDGDEERESLDVLSQVRGDLRDLLGNLRNPFARRLAGLQAALAALHDDDPTSRVRRAYIRLLLLLEGREQNRAAAQTPAEFAPVAVRATQASAPVASLTAAYERARYDPTGASADDATAAEAALHDISKPAARKQR